jgi:hypothetical protein
LPIVRAGVVGVLGALLVFSFGFIVSGSPLVGGLSMEIEIEYYLGGILFVYKSVRWFGLWFWSGDSLELSVDCRSHVVIAT